MDELAPAAQFEGAGVAMKLAAHLRPGVDEGFAGVVEDVEDRNLDKTGIWMRQRRARWVSGIDVDLCRNQNLKGNSHEFILWVRRSCRTFKADQTCRDNFLLLVFLLRQWGVTNVCTKRLKSAATSRPLYLDKQHLEDARNIISEMRREEKRREEKRDPARGSRTGRNRRPGQPVSCKPETRPLPNVTGANTGVCGPRGGEHGR